MSEERQRLKETAAFLKETAASCLLYHSQWRQCGTYPVVLAFIISSSDSDTQALNHWSIHLCRSCRKQCAALEPKI